MEGRGLPESIPDHRGATITKVPRFAKTVCDLDHRWRNNFGRSRFGLPAGPSALAHFFGADVGQGWLATARMLAIRWHEGPFCGLLFALIADKSFARLSEPIPGFLGA
jgi:hypothetical protein